MSRDEPRDTGIPTRAIHESYLQLQQTHQEYRQARDSGGDTKPAKAAFQDAILTFYELVRPHLKHESSLEPYWEGSLPDYTGWDFNSVRQGKQYIRNRGTGVYDVQAHRNLLELNQSALTDGGEMSYAQWHDFLGLSWDTERLLAAKPESDKLYVTVLRMAVLPLQELDNWQASIVRERTTGSGFMAGEYATQVRHEYQYGPKLVAAKRLLVEAADKLGALSAFEASTQTTEITREDIDKVEQWHQERTD